MKILNLKIHSESTLSSPSQIVFDYLMKAAWHPDTMEFSDEAIAKSTKLDLQQIIDAMTELEETGFIPIR